MRLATWDNQPSLREVTFTGVPYKKLLNISEYKTRKNGTYPIWGYFLSTPEVKISRGIMRVSGKLIVTEQEQNVPPLVRVGNTKEGGLITDLFIPLVDYEAYMQGNDWPDTITYREFYEILKTIISSQS